MLDVVGWGADEFKDKYLGNKERYEGPQLASSKFAPDFGLNKPVYVILCDHLT